MSSEQQIASLVATLLLVREFLDDRADADMQGDPPEYVPNAAMQLLGVVDAALRAGGGEH